MRVAIASDIHGNKHAFEAVIAAAQDAQVEELWCLGDLVGYGADPDACVALAEANCAICLAGNHDLAVVDVLSLEDFSRGAALAAQWTKDVIRPETREFLLGALARRARPRASGSTTRRRATRSGSTCSPALTAELCLDVAERAGQRVSLIGHSHVALSFHRPGGRAGDRLDAPRRRPARPRRRASGCSTPARPASRATATRARRGWCSTRRRGRPSGAAPSTTSPARRRRSARRGCRTRSRSGSSTGNEPVARRRARAARTPTPTPTSRRCGRAAASTTRGSSRRPTARPGTG